jgi:hemerythrin-like metal-binding protein
LFEYARFHFREEENLMETVGYPHNELESHRRLHGEFVERLEGLQSAKTTELMDYFREWLLRHIIAVDARIGHFLREKGSKPLT